MMAGLGGTYEFAEVWAVEVLEDVEEAVDEEGVVLYELVVLGDLARGQEAELRVDGVVPLHGRGGESSELRMMTLCAGCATTS